ncbi:MAG TPA: ABC transporter ATP-binding protein [Acidimicrobiales bacterium]|nr:ABC transporter ATP-binding protein [Acidimicrobiales bacterium]
MLPARRVERVAVSTDPVPPDPRPGPVGPEEGSVARHGRRLPSSPLIRLDSVTKRYGDTVAVDNLSLDVGAGEVCVLVGPSGCGKTTTMKMVNRLIEPTSGRIEVDGQDVLRLDPVVLRRRIGYVIQQVGLFPHQTVAENVATVPRLLGWDKRRVRARSHELLDLVGLDPARFAKRYPHELSGGQRQRVGVARALAGDPPVLLMDEPFGAIDPITRARLQAEFLRLQAEVRKTVVFVTHDIDEAVRVGDRIAILAEGGRLAQYDTPAVVLGRPANDFVAGFVGADRGVKRLSVITVERADLDPVRPGDGPRVALGSSMKDVLAALLDSPDGWVAVADHDAAIVGTLTIDSFHTAVRRKV